MLAKEADRAVADQVAEQSNHSSHVNDEHTQAPKSSFPSQEALGYSPNVPASYQPVTGGMSDSDQSTGRDQESVLLDACPAAYTLEWGPHVPCTRTPLDVDAVGMRSSDTSGNVGINVQAQVNAIRHEWRCNKNIQTSASAQGAKPWASSRTRKLFVFHITDDENINRTICSVLDIDPAFLASHAAGQRYRPRERPWRVGLGKKAAFWATSYVYPQTLTVTVPDHRVAPPRNMTEEGHMDSSGADARLQMPDPNAQNVNQRHMQPQDCSGKSQNASPAAIEIENREHTPLPRYFDPCNTKTIDSPVAVFCRASIWTSPCVNVLLLDQNPSSTCLEDALSDTLDDMSVDSSAATELELVADPLVNALSGLAYDQWLDFVDTLSLNRQGARQSKLNKRLLWDMAQRLEQNLATSRANEKQLDRQQQKDCLASPDDWQALLSRLQRTVALLPLQTQASRGEATAPGAARFMTADTSYTVNRISHGGLASLATHGIPEPEVDYKMYDPRQSSTSVINTKHWLSFSQTSAGQNALNRITYMGGFLLPFSIIAGVLSMSEPFGPGDRLFWVFWVITLPITAFTLVMIYADDIRRSYIWKPMNYKSLQEAISKGEVIPAAAAAMLAHAAERVIDKYSTVDSDRDIESATVLSAIRSVDSPGRYGGRARVRVVTNPGSRGQTLYRLSEPSQPEMTTASIPIQARSSKEDENVQNASVRHRTHILGPLRRAWPTRTIRDHGVSLPKPDASSSLFLDFSNVSNDIEPAIPLGETVVIDVARPNVDPSIAELFGPPDGVDVAAPGCSTILLPQQRREADPAAWRRQQLGWIGAMKKMTGYLKTLDA